MACAAVKRAYSVGNADAGGSALENVAKSDIALARLDM